MKKPNPPQVLTTSTVFTFKDNSFWLFLLENQFSILLQSREIISTEYWKQKQWKLSKILEDLVLPSFRIRIGCLYILVTNNWVLHSCNRVILVLGHAIAAMCYYLLKEEVTVKLTYLKNKIKDKIFLMKQTKKPSW